MKEQMNKQIHVGARLRPQPPELLIWNKNLPLAVSSFLHLLTWSMEKQYKSYQCTHLAFLPPAHHEVGNKGLFIDPTPSIFSFPAEYYEWSPSRASSG